MTRQPGNPGRRKRRRMLLVSAAPMLIGATLAVKLLSVGYLGGEAAGSFSRGDQAALSSAASVLGMANIVERHKAPFAAADALILGGDYGGARSLFEASLADAAPADECKVRVNLVLTIEHLADAAAAGAGPGKSADSAAEAAALYDDGLAAVSAAPPGCFSPEDSQDTPNGADGEGERLQEAEGRLQAKADQLHAGSGAQPGNKDRQQPQPEPEPRQSQLDKLEESAKSAQRERTGGMQRNEYLNNADAERGTEKPW
jgi:hypothetical protein